jgi:hypothetical protein
MVYGLVPGVLESLRAEIDREHVVPEPEIDVTVEDGIVTLTGRVESPATKEIAERGVKRVPGVRNRGSSGRAWQSWTKPPHAGYRFGPGPPMIGVMPTAEELLRITPIFSRLSQADRQTIAEVSRVQDFGKGETIFEQQSPSDAFYAIVSGRVKIMSRWNKDDIVRTDKDGFVVLAMPELERLAAG